VGEPDFATPPHVVAACKAALDAGDTRYTPVRHGAAARGGGAAFPARSGDRGAGLAGDRVGGGKQSIFLALLATLNPGDEVLIPAPWWVSYPEIVRFAGAEVVPMPTSAGDGFRISAEQLAAAITPPRAGCC
jgi:aspartate aminotransferase